MAKTTDPYVNYDELRRSRSRRLTLITLSLIVVLGGGIGTWLYLTAPAEAEVGKCLATVPTGADAAFVDCTDASAAYVIEGIIDSVLEQDVAKECLTRFGAGFVYLQGDTDVKQALCLRSTK